MTPQEMHRHARTVRARLYRPPNAVVDEGIDLRRKSGREIPAQEHTQASLPQQSGATKASPFLQGRPSIPPLPTRALHTSSTEEPSQKESSTSKPPIISLRRITYLVSKHSNVPMRELMEETRAMRNCLPRHVAIYLCIKLMAGKPAGTMPSIGFFFKKDASSIMNARDRVHLYLTTGHPYEAEVSNLIAKVKDELYGDSQDRPAPPDLGEPDLAGGQQEGVQEPPVCGVAEGSACPLAPAEKPPEGPGSEGEVQPPLNLLLAG